MRRLTGWDAAAAAAALAALIAVLYLWLTIPRPVGSTYDVQPRPGVESSHEWPVVTRTISGEPTVIQPEDMP